MSAQNYQQPENIIPLDLATSALRYWWVIVILMIFGALIGSIVHSVKPAVYEAKVLVNFSLDYNQTGPMTQFQEDYAVEVMGAVLRNPTVLQDLAELATNNGFPTSAQDLASHSRIERRMYTWVIRVFDPLPAKANWLAEQWAYLIDERVAYAYQHAVVAGELQRLLDASEVCFANVPSANQPNSSCIGINLEDLLGSITSMSEEIQYHRTESAGLAPYLLISKADVSPAEQEPIRQGRNMFLLAGSLLGGIVGIVILSVNPRSIFRN